MSQPADAASYSDEQRREAADWFVIIRSEKVAGADGGGTESIQAWLKWMDQDEGNRAAFDAVARAWHGVPSSLSARLPGDEELAADDYDGTTSVHEWLQRRGTTGVARSFRTRRTWRRTWAIAAGVLLALFGLIALNRLVPLRGPHTEEFTTRTGEQMEVTLSDGSRVWLGPRSKLLVTFERDRRGIQLSTGEAFFAVKKDAQRRFVVRSEGGDIVAVGTAFNVRAVDRQVTVAVSEGVVTVTPLAQLDVSAPASVRVASGQQLTFTAREPVRALAIVQSAATGDRARWREGVLVYRDEPLQQVIDDVLRYSDVPIEIADPAIGNLHYSGVIYRDALQEWLTALPESFPVTIKKDGSREIIAAR
ncbi:MAG TPA: FecR domain-containing protein [Steroidobacteraceae bacterium]|jgi:transmembrane sensor|nr:FecR domain-containing protein [Steroidobacteraceae bacterium]